MKKVALLLTTFVLFPFWSFGQNIIVNQYNNVGNGPSENNTASDQICGIPASMDIGGVQMQTRSTGGYFRGDPGCPWKAFVFTNYNSVPVTVFYEYYDARDGERSSGSVVLKSNETKKTPKMVAPSDIKMIAIQNGVKANNNYVGGVEVIKRATGGYYQGDPYSPVASYLITNYNDFAVTVNYTLYDGRSGNTSGSLVLHAGESKETDKYVGPSKFSMRVRKLN